MSFVYPAGLWTLLGLAVLAGLCLLRHRSEVTPVSSAYLWRLSEQRRKKRRYLRTIKRALLFVLQFSAIALAALLVAQPVLPLPGSGVHAAVILDASGSMQMRDETGQTRFARAVSAVEKDMGSLPWGASVTVVLAGDKACLAADHVRAGAELRAALEDVACGWGDGDMAGAAALCQKMLDEGRISSVCLYTDTPCVRAEGLDVVCLRGENEWNVSVGALSDAGSIYGTAFETTVISSGRDADVRLALQVDGELQDEQAIELCVNGRTQESAVVHCPKDEQVSVSLLLHRVYDFSDARLTVQAQDGIAQDNETCLNRRGQHPARVLLVGEKTYFWQKALEALPRTELTLAEDWRETALEGYDVYAFDGCLPEKLPQDGAVWLLNPPRSPREIGVVLGERWMGAYLADAHTGGALEERLTRGLVLRDAAVARFREITAQGALENVLLCGQMPVMAAGTGESGCALIVMSFDLQESNLPLLTDYIVLVHNLLEVSAPTLMSERTVNCGSIIYPQVHPLCGRLFLQTPDMRLEALDVRQVQNGVYIGRPGSYTLLQEVRGEQQVVSFSAQVPMRERRTSPEPDTEIVLAAGGGSGETETQPQVFYPARMMALVLLVLLLAEWGMYHREQY